jgi:L-threonylcarbamoyladenylate synthase
VLRAAPSAQVLSALQPADLVTAAEILANGGVAALPFNGMFALFGDIDQPRIHARIMAAKNRPHDKRLAMVTLPEHAHELADFDRTSHPEYKVLALWQDLHGLGIILPSTQRASEAQQAVQHTDGTTLLVWTEYPPLRRILEHFRSFGGQALFGTSANKSGLQTYTTTREVFRDFFTEVDVIVADEFSTLPAQRRQSMTILDLTGQQPRLHRPGSVRVSELHAALKQHGFPPLRVGVSLVPGR